MDWLGDNATALLAVLVALAVAGYAEGGRRRRSLRWIKEEFDVLALAEARGVPDHVSGEFRDMLTWHVLRYTKGWDEKSLRRWFAIYWGFGGAAVLMTGFWLAVLQFSDYEEGKSSATVLWPFLLAMTLFVFGTVTTVLVARNETKSMERYVQGLRSRYGHDLGRKPDVPRPDDN